MIDKNHKKYIYPLIPLRDMVVFPGNTSSLFVGREKSMKATKVAMDSDRRVILITQKNIETILPEKENLYNIGVLCEIIQLLNMPDGTLKILLEGLNRVKVTNFIDDGDYLKVKFEVVKSEFPQKEVEKLVLEKVYKKIIKDLNSYNVQQNATSDNLIESIIQKNSKEILIDSVAYILPLPFYQKQGILESFHLLERAESVSVALENQLGIQKLEESIHYRVQKQIDNVNKRFYLNEQMKIIQKELGESEFDEIELLKKEVESKEFPDEIKKHLLQEIKKLEKMPPLSSESTVVRNYLDWLIDLPWNEATEDNKDISSANEILESSHHGLKKVKERILEFIAVKQLAPESKGAILCLVGPPGVGKTSLARSLADSLEKKFAAISLGGIRDEAEIRGHRKTYLGSMPGRIISTLKRLQVKNPVILLDELDKISSDYRGNPAAALLEVLDPEQNQEFVDHYLEVPFDLSKITFVATANITHSIPDPLLDRLEIIELSGYTEQEKIRISERYLFPRQIKNSGIKDIKINYNFKSFAYIIRCYTKEAGVRQLERQYAQICRKVAREYLEKNQASLEKNENSKKALEYNLNKDQIHKFLGPPKFSYGKKEKKVFIGKCNGLAWTSAGGDILYLEVVLAHGKGKLTLTGNLGDVMKESANTALGYVRSKSHLLGLTSDFFEKTDIFVHVPEGAIPKDGPSAGVAITVCLISALTQSPVKSNIALTGEVTLRGIILPIGGLKEKALAAFRGGINEIICPKENERDLDEMPERIRKKLKFHLVSNIEEALSLALLIDNKIFQEKPNTYPFYANHLPRLQNESRLS